MIYLVALLSILVPLSTALTMSVVLKHLRETTLVGGEPKDVVQKKLEIAKIQAELAKTKEEAKAAVAQAHIARSNGLNIHE